MDGKTKQMTSQEIGARLADRIDPRMADVWGEVFACEEADLPRLVGWFLRMAYVRGFTDALEGERWEPLLDEDATPRPRLVSRCDPRRKAAPRQEAPAFEERRKR